MCKAHVFLLKDRFTFFHEPTLICSYWKRTSYWTGCTTDILTCDSRINIGGRQQWLDSIKCPSNSESTCVREGPSPSGIQQSWAHLWVSCYDTSKCLLCNQSSAPLSHSGCKDIPKSFQLQWSRTKISALFLWIYKNQISTFQIYSLFNKTVEDTSLIRIYGDSYSSGFSWTSELFLHMRSAVGCPSLFTLKLLWELTLCSQHGHQEALKWYIGIWVLS